MTRTSERLSKMALTDPPFPHRAAVVGSPVAHSLSPVLHGAAYAALGLDWTYERVERDADGLVEFVRDLGEEWVGLSVTMPGKHAALEIAAERSARAVAVGAANTLVRRGDMWFADCTDVDGVVGAVRCAGGFSTGTRGLILGAGGTAAAALAAFAVLGLREATLAVRDPSRARGACATGDRVGVRVRVERFDELDLAAQAAASDVVVSTLPGGAADHYAEAIARAKCVLDVVYHPWPTPLATAVQRAGGRLATGLDMLLHQAFGQVELFAGVSAPRERMRDALSEATGGELALPL
jgi:shikimate dehydrogenase